MTNQLVKSTLKKSATSKVAPKDKKTASVQSVPAPKEDQDWRAADDLRVLTQAEQIRKDKGRMKAVASHAKEHMNSINSALSGTVSRGK